MAVRCPHCSFSISYLVIYASLALLLIWLKLYCIP